MCDFAEGKNLVPVSAEDTEYFYRMKSGHVQVENGGLVFFCYSGNVKYRVEHTGQMDSVVENNVSGSRDIIKGIVGKVGRQTDCNAYEFGSYSDINGGAIRTTPFRVYRISPEPMV